MRITDFVVVLGDREGGVLAEYQEKVPGTNGTVVRKPLDHP